MMQCLSELIAAKIDYLSLTVLLLLNGVFIYIAFVINGNMFSTLHDTPTFLAFQDPTYIYFGLTVNISTSIPTIVDLLMDIQNYRDLTFDDGAEDEIDSGSWIERFFLAILSIVPGSVVLLLRQNENIPIIYASVHSIQSVGSIGIMLLICKKQFPKYFTSTYILGTMLCATSASITGVLGFGYGVSNWANILKFVSILAGLFFLFGKICAPFVVNLWLRLVVRGESLSIGETCSMWYFWNTMITLTFVHGVVSTIKLYAWTNYTSWDINVFVYSFALYSINNCTVPGRLIRFAVDKEQKKLVHTKRSLIRYMSHEVRSPLNVIYSGLNFLVGDLKNLPAFVEKASLMETFTTIRQASDDLLQTMNNLLMMESIDSAAFSIEAHMTPCTSLTKIADRCSALAQEKGIAFTVNNQFDLTSNPVCEGAALLGGGDIELGPAPVEAADLTHSLFIDDFKIGEVVKNLVTNSLKFTPEGKSIAVNIRPATAADLTDLEDDSRIENHDTLSDKKPAVVVVPVEKEGYTLAGDAVIEVKDTGMGIAPVDRENMLRQFDHFDTNKLQVPSTCIHTYIHTHTYKYIPYNYTYMHTYT